MPKNIIITITYLMATVDIQRQVLLYIPPEQEVLFPPVVLCSDILFPLLSSFLFLVTSAVSWPRQDSDVGWALTHWCFDPNTVLVQSVAHCLS